MNLAFHKHYEFSQIAQSILSKWTIIFLGPHSGQGISPSHIFTTLIGINDILISFFSPFPLSPRPATHLFFSVINTAVGRIGHYGLPAGSSLELFSLVQDGSALPASLRHGIEQSIKVYLSICQLQWAV